MSFQLPKRWTVGPSVLVLLCAGAVLLNLRARTSAEGSITGTVKLQGTAPHMRGIDMSKDPYCVKQHANNPAHLQTVVVGSDSGLENVVLYISEGLPANVLAE